STRGAALISAALTDVVSGVVSSTPDDHFTASPRCRVMDSTGRHIDDAGGRPTIRAGIVFTPGVRITAAVLAAPHDHITAGPDGSMILSGSGRVGDRGSCPAIADGIISAAGVQVNVVDAAKSAQAIISFAFQDGGVIC